MIASLSAFLDFFGIAVFAASGTLTACQKRLDIFGVLVIALITCLGGGTLRDVILGVDPIWIADSRYLWLGMMAAISTFIVQRFVRLPLKLLDVFDGIGLAFFTLAGVQKALGLGMDPEIAVLMGLMTGVAGGIMRDVLCNDIPLIFHREIYATAAISGGLLFTLLLHLGQPETLSMLAGMAVIIGLRLLGIFFGLALPRWLLGRPMKS
ncbi:MULTISPECIES: trimeric intracellular cation channel family protein [Spongiibacter]|uniref:trimeric intracellular cation channel family protein n=1 Tax=Spongiibacter TaxID=630749 RepID=UPI0023524D78|nr:MULTISPECIES: trimeric intracellular cation channel family protein [Spongiibacter]